jgi:hypothetical protein
MIYSHAPTEPKIPASERIEHVLGEEYVERHREEVLAEEQPKIERQVKKQLLKDPEFQREVIEEIHKQEPTETACPMLPPIKPDPNTKPLPENYKETLTVTCPKCGYKFEW